MKAAPFRDNKGLAILCAFAGVGIGSSSDAIVKWMSGSYPAHQLLFIRCLVGLPILAAIVYRQAGFAALFAPGWQLSLARGAIMSTAYLAYIMAIAAMPLADVVAISFTMPLMIAILAGPLLGEEVRLHRWLAITGGLVGVLIMVKPGNGVFEPAALLALYAAFTYALGQALARKIGKTVPPAIMAFHSNAIYFAVAVVLAAGFALLDLHGIEQKSLAFLVRPWLMPSPVDFAAIMLAGTTVAFAMVLFGTAYKYAESSFVAPFEYTAMFWAVVLGFAVFGDVPGVRTVIGAAIVLTAGLFMLWVDQRTSRTAAASEQPAA